MLKEKILLIQSTQTQCNGTKQHLEDRWYQVVWAGSGLTALTMASNGDIDLILLDVALPDSEGLDLCHRFRARNDTHSIPIILVVGRGYTPERSVARSLGPDDYLTKPYTGPELEAKIAAVLGAKAAEKKSIPSPASAPRPDLHSVHMQELQPKIDPPQASVERPVQKAKEGTVVYLRPVAKPEGARLSKHDDVLPSPIIPFHGTGDPVIDPSTGLFGRSQFEAMFSKDFKRALRFKQQLSCMLIELEDQDGSHTADEAMVKSIIQLVQETIREVDTAAWWSGRSFIVLLPNTIRNDALQAAARLLEAVATHSFTWPDSTRVTMNIGVTGLPDKNIDTEKKMIEAADALCKRARELMVPSPDHASFLNRQTISQDTAPCKEPAIKR